MSCYINTANAIKWSHSIDDWNGKKFIRYDSPGEELELEDIEKAYAILSQIVSLAAIEPCRKSKVLTTFVFYYRIMCMNVCVETLRIPHSTIAVAAKIIKIIKFVRLSIVKRNFFTLHRSWWSGNFYSLRKAIKLFRIEIMLEEKVKWGTTKKNERKKNVTMPIKISSQIDWLLFFFCLLIIVQSQTMYAIITIYRIFSQIHSHADANNSFASLLFHSPFFPCGLGSFVFLSFRHLNFISIYAVIIVTWKIDYNRKKLAMVD